MYNVKKVTTNVKSKVNKLEKKTGLALLFTTKFSVAISTLEFILKVHFCKYCAFSWSFYNIVHLFQTK